MAEPEENPLTGVDRARPLSEGLRARLEESLLAAASGAEAGPAQADDQLLAGVDRARPIPAEARSRLETGLVDRRGSRARPARPRPATAGASRSGRLQRWVPAAAAVVVLMVAATSVVIATRRDQPFAGQADSLATGAANEAGLDSAGEAGFAPPPFTVAGQDLSTTGSDPALGLAAPSSASGRSSADFAAESSGSPAAPAAPPAPPPLTVELSGPESDVSAGFRAYLGQTAAAGGVAGRRVEAVGPGSEGPGSEGAGAEGALATVNTSLEVPIAPGGRRPLLEGPAAAGRLLAGQVFSFSAAPERLAYLAVDGLNLRNARVAVFTGTGVFAEVVPDAFATALRSQTSKVERVSGGGRPARWPEADLAVLALGGEDTRAWLEAARERGYSPRLGVSGIYNLADPSVVELLPDGSAVVSPYAAPQPGEAEAMREAAGGTPSFGFTHGWVTAKAVALAMWRSGAETPKQLGAALSNLTGEDLNGMIAPYSVRPGTNSRTPEGILSKVKDEKLVALGGFRGSGRT